jgi:hypothetical protein
MVPRMERMLEMILSLMPRDGSGLDENWIESIEIDCARTLGELLAIADDAQIEGGRSGFDPDAVVDAVGTLRQIAHRLGSLAAERDSQEMPMLPPQLQSARDAIDSALRSHFEACLDYVKRRAAGGGALKAWKGTLRGRCSTISTSKLRRTTSAPFHRGPWRRGDLCWPRSRPIAASWSWPASFPISSRASRRPGPRHLAERRANRSERSGGGGPRLELRASLSEA